MDTTTIHSLPGRASRYSTPDDIDSRTDSRRRLRGTYELHADDVDAIRVAFDLSLRQCIAYVNDPVCIGPDYWVDEAWQIDRACRALGIES